MVAAGACDTAGPSRHQTTFVICGAEQAACQGQMLAAVISMQSAWKG